MNKKEKFSDCWRTPQDLFDVLDKGGFYQGIKFDGFHFDIDLCATAENSKCLSYYVDYLNDQIGHKTADYVRKMSVYDLEGDIFSCFMNPPYSNPKPFIEKAWEDSKYCKIVCLVKCDPSTKWWATFWDYFVDCDHSNKTFISEWAEPMSRCLRCKNEIYKGPKPGCEVIFLPKRIRFTPPNDELLRGDTLNRDIGIRRPGPTFASALVIMDRSRINE